jgi:toxin-antitoxin system PIN domain toxin
MILIDVNILVYAYNTSSEFHERAREWLDNILTGREPVRLAWTTIMAFLRITTHPNIFPAPFETRQALETIDRWLAQPAVEILEPGKAYWSILGGLLQAAQLRGPGVMDAELAALAIEHGAVLYSADRDFLRFEGLQVKNPFTAG